MPRHDGSQHACSLPSILPCEPSSSNGMLIIHDGIPLPRYLSVVWLNCSFFEILPDLKCRIWLSGSLTYFSSFVLSNPRFGSEQSEPGSLLSHHSDRITHLEITPPLIAVKIMAGTCLRNSSRSSCDHHLSPSDPTRARACVAHALIRGSEIEWGLQLRSSPTSSLIALSSQWTAEEVSGVIRAV